MPQLTVSQGALTAEPRPEDRDAFQELAAGEEVTRTTTKNEIRTGEAAKLLNISRQYLVRLCEEAKIPYRIDGDGKHRRLAQQDVFAYRHQRDEARRVSFREYVAEVAASGEYDIPVTWDPQE